MKKSFYRIDSFDGRTSIGCLLRRLNNLMIPRAEARFANEDISFTHWVALMCLRDGLADTCADIARYMSYDAGAITRLVDQLEQRGLVGRDRSKKDRRVVHLFLTAEGKAVTKALVPRTMEFWNEMLDDFSTAESKMLIDLLSRLLDRMENTSAVPPVRFGAVA